MESKKKSVSYSQLSMYQECNYHWYLAYVRGLKSNEKSIHLLFGSSMHSTLQEYLKEMFDHSIKNADAIDLIATLQKKTDGLTLLLGTAIDAGCKQPLPKQPKPMPGEIIK